MLRRTFGPKKDRDFTVRGELKQVMNRQLGFEPWTCRLRDLIIYFRLTNRGRYVGLALEIWREKVVLEEGWRHVTSERRDKSQCLWNPILDPFTVIIRPTESYIVTRPKIFVLQAWGYWTQIRAFACAVWFSQLVWVFKKLHSAYWGRQNLCFGQWEYFGIWRDDSFVEQTEDAKSDARDPFWYIESEGRVVWSSCLPQQKFIVKIKILIQECIARR
jgi:hypothetical protein